MHFRTEIQIQNLIEEVYTYVKNGENLDKWNSAVKQVNKLEAISDHESTYSIIRKLPNDVIENTIKVTHKKKIYEITIETIAGPTDFNYKIKLVPFRGETRLILNAEVDKNTVASFLGSKLKKIPKFIIRKMVEKRTTYDLYTLKVVMESLNSTNSAQTNRELQL